MLTSNTKKEISQYIKSLLDIWEVGNALTSGEFRTHLNVLDYLDEDKYEYEEDYLNDMKDIFIKEFGQAIDKCVETFVQELEKSNLKDY